MNRLYGKQVVKEWEPLEAIEMFMQYNDKNNRELLIEIQIRGVLALHQAWPRVLDPRGSGGSNYS